MKVRFDKESLKAKGNQISSKMEAKVRKQKSRKQENDRIRWDVMLRMAPSRIVDCEATLLCEKLSDPFICTGELSHTQFHVPMGQVVPATETAKLLHDVQEPATMVELVPAMKQDMLISVGKFADVGYITIFDGEEVNIYDGLRANLKIHEKEVVKGWRDPAMGLYRIPLKEKVDNLNTDTVLLDKERSQKIQSERPKITEAVNNVYKLPLTVTAI